MQAVCVSACGNFGFVGTSIGEVLMYNMQSGMWRRKYELGATPSEVTSRKQITDKGRVVNGIATDSLNKLAIASTSDGVIYVSLLCVNTTTKYLIYA